MTYEIRFDGEVLGKVETNRSMTLEEICDACGVELAQTEEDYNGMPENGKYDWEFLEVVETSGASRYVIRDSETGTLDLGRFPTLEAAKEQIAAFEEYDMKNKIFAPGSYEIYDTAQDDVVEVGVYLADWANA